MLPLKFSVDRYRDAHVLYQFDLVAPWAAVEGRVAEDLSLPGDMSMVQTGGHQPVPRADPSARWESGPALPRCLSLPRLTILWVSFIRD